MLTRTDHPLPLQMGGYTLGTEDMNRFGVMEGIPFERGDAGPEGLWVVLAPLAGVHTRDKVESVRERLRAAFSTPRIDTEWQACPVFYRDARRALRGMDAVRWTLEDDLDPDLPVVLTALCSIGHLEGMQVDGYRYFRIRLGGGLRGRQTAPARRAA